MRSSVVVMLACAMISWSIFGGYPAWIMSEAAVRLRSCTWSRSLTPALLRAGRKSLRLQLGSRMALPLGVVKTRSSAFFARGESRELAGQNNGRGFDVAGHRTRARALPRALPRSS
jgi:hypothetical protein